jgi:carboxypeptidase T
MEWQSKVTSLFTRSRLVASLALTAALASLAIAPMAKAATASPSESENDPASEMRFVQIAAKTREQRSAIANTGMSIEATRSDSVWGFANRATLAELSNKGYRVMGDFDFATGRGGHEGMFDFPSTDSKFHNYKELSDELRTLEERNPDLVRIHSIGKTVENRDIWAVHINTNARDLDSGSSSRPGAIFMGNHHAREHLSLEVPLLLAKHLVDNRRAPNISKLLDSRDIWIIPSVNPDGAEYDVAGGNYRMWRKNRTKNNGRSYGVDLNRNYSFGWGTGGSSKDPSSDVYMGPSAFSEPESRAIRDFVNAHLNAKVLLTFHTFSELILYPWGGKFDAVANQRDRDTFVKMAKTMSAWNHYKPEQSSELYIASGDTVDWAYGTHGIFAFTFEMSPTDMMDGGFYPGQDMIEKAFNDNLKPCLYMMDVADDPTKILGDKPGGFLRNYVEPAESDLDTLLGRVR